MQAHDDRHAAGERLRSEERAGAMGGPGRWEDRDENEEE
jgi:hypothetical protein